MIHLSLTHTPALKSKGTHTSPMIVKKAAVEGHQAFLPDDDSDEIEKTTD